MSDMKLPDIKKMIGFSARVAAAKLAPAAGSPTSRRSRS